MNPPGWAEGRPVVPSKIVWVWTAFWDLGTTRQTGFGIGPIPWTAIDEYARRFRIEGDEFERFHFLIRAMDSVYLKHHAPKGKDEK